MANFGVTILAGRTVFVVMLWKVEVRDDGAEACLRLPRRGTIGFRTGGMDLVDEPNRDAARRLQNDQTPVADLEGLNTAGPGPPRRWGRPERNRLFIWVGIGFLLPGIPLLLLRAPLKSNSSVFTIQSELPVKAILAFFVVLAT